MNGEKPLNILADQEYKPDIEVTTKSSSQGGVPVPPPPAPIAKPQTALQDALGATIGKIVPPTKNQPGMPASQAPIPPSPTEALNDSSAFKNYLQKPIRTYEGDIAELMSQHKTSTASMVIAETKKVEQMQKAEAAGIPDKTIVDEEEARPKGGGKKIILALVSLILIAGGAYGGYYLYKQSAFALPEQVATKPVAIQSIIPYDKQNVFMVDGIAEGQFVPRITAELNKNTSGSAQVIELVLGEKSGETSVRVTGSSFIKKAAIEMPSTLARSLTDQWMLGTYNEDSGVKTPFLIFTTDFFQNAFAGMLAWEASMPDELADILNFKEKARAGETTASSSIASYFSIRGKFIDKQIQNRDVREFIGRQDETLFLYSFIDKDTIVFTTTESALKGLLGRVEKETYVR